MRISDGSGVELFWVIGHQCDILEWEEIIVHHHMPRDDVRRQSQDLTALAINTGEGAPGLDGVNEVRKLRG